MTIIEVINEIKRRCRSNLWGQKIEDVTTRDKVLYGDCNQECTGIVTTCFASVDVIKKAASLGYNFIISHEALFWNRGDKTDWLSDSKVLQEKMELLDKYHICVFRWHDYIHAGVPYPDGYRDGIFYGVANQLGWVDYISTKNDFYPDEFIIPKTSVTDLAKHLKEKFHLNGIRIVGDKNAVVSKILIPMHYTGGFDDNPILKRVIDEDVDCLLAMEMNDYTINEYIRDAAYLNKGKCVITIGHFNLEEAGMEYIADYLPNILGNNIPIKFIQSGDAFDYII